MFLAKCYKLVKVIIHNFRLFVYHQASFNIPDLFTKER